MWNERPYLKYLLQTQKTRPLNHVLYIFFRIFEDFHHKGVDAEMPPKFYPKTKVSSNYILCVQKSGQLCRCVKNDINLNGWNAHIRLGFVCLAYIKKVVFKFKGGKK